MMHHIIIGKPLNSLDQILEFHSTTSNTIHTGCNFVNVNKDS